MWFPGYREGYPEKADDLFLEMGVMVISCRCDAGFQFLADERVGR